MIRKELRQMVAGFEGCYLKSYKCPAGVWTIGYGHTGKLFGVNINKGMKVTYSTATRLLEEDLEATQKLLLKRSKFKECDNMYFKECMISFAFNCGVGNFDKISKGRDWYAIFVAFKEYCHAKVNGKSTVLRGLQYRRRSELKHALTFAGKVQKKGDYSKPTTNVIQGMLNEYRVKFKADFKELKRDSCYGELTTRAVKNFQKRFKLLVTGEVNKATFEKLRTISKLYDYKI